MDYGHGIDCADRPYGGMVANAQYGYIFRYLSDGGSSIPGKQLLPDEAKSYLDAGVRLVSNWETTADMMLRGYAGGKIDSDNAWSWHRHCGGPDDATIYYSCDFDTTPQEQVVINAYLQACIDQYGLDQTGVYGSYYVCERARQAFPGIKTWQTLAWSGGQTSPNNTVLQLIGTVYVGNVACDRNIINDIGNVGAWNEDRMNSQDIQNAVLNTPIVSAVDGKTYTLGYILAAIDYKTFGLGSPAITSLVDQSTKLTLAQFVQAIDLHTNSLSTKLDTLTSVVLDLVTVLKGQNK